MEDTNYFYHGLQNPSLLENILKEGLLSRSYLKKQNKDKFSSKKDFLNDEGTNGLENICVCTYNSLSFYLFAYPNITLIIKNDNNYKITSGGLDGEYLIEDKVPKENIIGVGIRDININKYDKSTYNYIKSLKENIEFIKKYKLKIINLNTNKEVKEKELTKLFKYLNVKKRLNILLIGTTFSGKKDILKNLDYKKCAESNIKTKKEFINRYKLEKNNKDILIFQDSLLDYKTNFTKEEWTNILKELNIKEKDLINNYDIVIHLYSMVNKYKNIYNNDIPKQIKIILKKDESIDKTYNKNNNYFKVLPKTDIREKLNEVVNILENFV